MSATEAVILGEGMIARLSRTLAHPCEPQTHVGTAGASCIPEEKGAGQSKSYCGMIKHPASCSSVPSPVLDSMLHGP